MLPFLFQKSKITALTCYCDLSGLFTIERPSDDSPEEQIVKLARIKKYIYSTHYVFIVFHLTL